MKPEVTREYFYHSHGTPLFKIMHISSTEVQVTVIVFVVVPRVVVWGKLENQTEMLRIVV